MGASQEAFAELSFDQTEFHACLTGRGDALFEPADALLCSDGPVKTQVELSLAPESSGTQRGASPTAAADARRSVTSPRLFPAVRR
jgi:hypothetical protein